MKKNMKAMAMLIAVFLLSAGMLPAADEGHLPGQHLDGDSKHSAEFLIQAYKKDKSGGPDLATNKLSIQFFDQISLKEGALGPVETNAAPSADVPMDPTDISPYAPQFFTDGLLLGILNMNGFVAPGAVTDTTESLSNTQKVKLEITPYKPNAVDAKTGYISSVDGTVNEFNLYNVDKADVSIVPSVPFTISLVERIPLTVINDVEWKPTDSSAWTETDSTGAKVRKSPGFRKAENKDGLSRSNPNQFDLTVTIDSQSPNMRSVQLKNDTSFTGFYDKNHLGHSSKEQSQLYVDRRAIGWEYSLNIFIKTTMKKEDYKALPSGRYSTVLNIVVTTE